MIHKHVFLVKKFIYRFYHLTKKKERKKIFADFHKVEQVVLKITRKAIKPFKMMGMMTSIAKFSFPYMYHYSEHTTKGPVCYHITFCTGVVFKWYN